MPLRWRIVANTWQARSPSPRIRRLHTRRCHSLAINAALNCRLGKDACRLLSETAFWETIDFAWLCSVDCRSYRARAKTTANPIASPELRTVEDFNFRDISTLAPFPHTAKRPLSGLVCKTKRCDCPGGASVRCRDLEFCLDISFLHNGERLGSIPRPRPKPPSLGLPGTRCVRT